MINEAASHSRQDHDRCWVWRAEQGRPEKEDVCQNETWTVRHRDRLCSWGFIWEKAASSCPYLKWDNLSEILATEEAQIILILPTLLQGWVIRRHQVCKAAGRTLGLVCEFLVSPRVGFLSQQYQEFTRRHYQYLFDCFCFWCEGLTVCLDISLAQSLIINWGYSVRQKLFQTLAFSFSGSGIYSMFLNLSKPLSFIKL